MHSHSSIFFPTLSLRTLLEVISDAEIGVRLNFSELKNNDNCQLYIRPHIVSEALKDAAVNAMDFWLSKNELLNTRFVELGQARISIMFYRGRL